MELNMYVPTKKIGGDKLSPAVKIRGSGAELSSRSSVIVIKDFGSAVGRPKVNNLSDRKGRINYSNQISSDYSPSDHVANYVARRMADDSGFNVGELDLQRIKKIISNKIRGLFGTILDGMAGSGLSEVGLFNEKGVFSEPISVALKARIPVYMDDVSFFLKALSTDFNAHLSRNNYESKNWLVCRKDNNIWLVRKFIEH